MKTTWSVQQTGENRIVVTNNRNASLYEYAPATQEAFLTDPVTIAARTINPRGFDPLVAKPFLVWVLTARDRHGKSLEMREYTVAPITKELRADLLEEATYLAGYLTRSRIREAKDGPHIDAYMESNPVADFQCAPVW